MRKSILIPAILAFGAATAGAACTDTLFLQSLTVYKQTLRNTATIGTWDSVSINAWDSADVINASPLTLTPYEGAFRSPFDTLNHPLRFSSNCGNDSISPILYARVISDTISTNRYIWKSIFSSAKINTTDTIRWSWIRNGMYYWIVGTDTLKANDIWRSGSFTLGSDTITNIIEGWRGRVLGLAINKPTRYNSGDSAWPSVSVLKNYHTYAAFKMMVASDLSSQVSAVANYVDSIGNGHVDSTRFELRMYRSVFSKQNPTSIRINNISSRNFSVRSMASGVDVQLSSAARIHVVGLDGRVVHSFEGRAGHQVWDGRDAFGNSLHGVWLIRAEGLGAKTVLVH